MKKSILFLVAFLAIGAYFLPRRVVPTGTGGPSADVSSTPLATATDTYAGICLGTPGATSTYALVSNTTKNANGYDIICGGNYVIHCAGTQDTKLSPKDSGLQCQ